MSPKTHQSVAYLARPPSSSPRAATPTSTNCSIRFCIVVLHYLASLCIYLFPTSIRMLSNLYTCSSIARFYLLINAPLQLDAGTPHKLFVRLLPAGTMGTTGYGNGTILTRGYPCIDGNPWYHPRVMVPVPEYLLSTGDGLRKFDRYQYPRVSPVRHSTGSKNG